MSDVPENDKEEPTDASEKSKLSGFSQYIAGEIETIGGVLTGDPLTQAEGEFNVEVGTVREDIEDDLEDDEDDNKE
jgi:uncharacterized protein YjbJ (UPF0337 family)